MNARAGSSPSGSARRIVWGLVVLASSLVAGCAILEPLYPGPDLPLVESGRALAFGECSACHAVGPSGGAPATGAPSFSSIAERYRNYRLDWELETISQVGHYRMPAKMLSSPEIAALTAYIRTLDSGKPSEDPTPPVR